jgi:DNA-binding NtrC family response regulator
MTGPSQSSDSRPTVLVLEDEEGLADLFEAWLTEQYRVRTVNDATAAREVFDYQVAVAVLDRRLPDGSGDAVLEWVASEYPDCRRVMVTAVNPDLEHADLPFDDYLLKPVARADLEDAVARLVEQRSRSASERERYALETKRLLLEAEYSGTRLADSEVYQSLTAALEDRPDAESEPEASPAIAGRLERGARGRWSDD